MGLGLWKIFAHSEVSVNEVVAVWEGGLVTKECYECRECTSGAGCDLGVREEALRQCQTGALCFLLSI